MDDQPSQLPPPKFPWNLVIATALISGLVAGSAVYFYSNRKPSIATPLPSSTASPTPVATASNTYSNQYFSVQVPAGWTATPVQGDAKSINITKANYILYINTQATQASGVIGGRFAEIAQGAPSADATIKNWPGDPCQIPEITPARHDLLYSQRADLYVDSTASNCNIPSDGQAAWYFSYLTNDENHYFNDYVDGQNPGLVVTMAYQTKTVNDLPKKGSADLTAALKEMTDIAYSLEVKTK